MLTYRADLSVSSLDKLLSDVQSYKEKLQAAPQKIEADLAAIGAISVETSLSGITDPDGNSVGTVGVEEMPGGGTKVYNQGAQVAYLEYGTGEQGEAKSHPQSGKVGWNYGSGPRIKRMKNGKMMWRYYDKLKGHWRITNGLPAQMQVYSAALAMRERISQAAKEALK